MDIRKLFQWGRVGITAGVPVLHFNNKYFKKFKKNKDKYSLQYRYEKINLAIDKVLKSFHVDYYIDGYEKYENLQSKCLLISNHLSDMDPLIMTYKCKRLMTFVSKKENMDKIVVGNILHAMEAIPLDRDNVMKQISQIRDTVNMIKAEDKPDVCIYAEGTRNRKPETSCMEMHAGSFKMAYMANAPIIPIAIYGTFRILSMNMWLKRYPIHIKFLDPIYPEEYKNMSTVELADKVRKLIDEEVNEMRKLDYEVLKKQKLSSKRFIKETKVDKIGN